jgi:hypothetical protein
MATPDPIAPVIQALSVLVAPDPPLNTTSPQSPGTWTGGSNTATDGTLFTPAQVLLGLLFDASDDLTSLGGGINSALTGAASALSSLAGEIGNLATVETDATTAFTALQTVLGLAQGVAPSSATGTLASVGALFKQIQSLIAAFPNLGVAAAELAELSQQLTAAAPLFPSA